MVPLGLPVAFPILLDRLSHPRARIREPVRLSIAQIFLNVGHLPFAAEMDVRRFRSHRVQEHLFIPMLRQGLDIDRIRVR